MKYNLFVPGRTELLGNHTDHQNGRILAAAIDLGISAEFEDNHSNIIRVSSEGFEPMELRLGFPGVRTQDFGKSLGLLRGVVSVFGEYGLKVGGFNAKLNSSLPINCGMGSSAAFAIVIGRILSVLFNHDSVAPIVLARIGQQAESRFYGKPCGTMDHLVCALGHCVYVDFTTGEISPMRADYSAMGLTLCITETGGSRVGLANSYARIPADMTYIANLFDKGCLGDVSPAEFRAKGWDVSDRPVRRAMHFFDENERVVAMRDALLRNDGQACIAIMNASGRSSERLLNNIVTSSTGDTKLAEGLEKSCSLLDGQGAWRVHGGGFAGGVQALMPSALFPDYRRAMEEEFGAGSCREIRLI